MTTDNRTNEPTPEQVEVAAKAIYGLDPWCAGGDRRFSSRPTYAWEELEHPDRAEYLSSARAALEAAARAAQGAARPVNSFDTTAERVKTEADSLHVAPVLPSSGVDKDELAKKLEHWIFQYNQERITLKTFVDAVVEAIGGETPSKTA